MKYLTYILLTLTLLSACKNVDDDGVDENYKELFPFEGISKPETSYEDMNVTPCDPDMALSSYRYPGVTISDDVREYEVTIRCKYDIEANINGHPNLEVRYIAPDKEIKTISSNTQNTDADMHITKGQEFTKTFRVHSGYPLYLSVSGTADRGSSITASISAHSIDGYIVVPTLKTTQSQNKEGINPLPSPYCEYIILP